MVSFKIISQQDVNEYCQGLSLSEFSYSNMENISETEIFDVFIHSKSFAEDSRREVIKNYVGDGNYLQQAFEIDLVKPSDFKIFDKYGVRRFLNGFADSDDLAHKFDKAIFEKHKDDFLKLLESVQINN